jgi:hypothetical protein
MKASLENNSHQAKEKDRTLEALKMISVTSTCLRLNLCDGGVDPVEFSWN